mmetsp:Transcript_3294/g.4819  ORF Transcript_3294/g.4819 Transcript_3294/m.4819 type:complete len:142 (-) Transcript_3294:417-842(-)
MIADVCGNAKVVLLNLFDEQLHQFSFISVIVWRNIGTKTVTNRDTGSTITAKLKNQQSRSRSSLYQYFVLSTQTVPPHSNLPLYLQYFPIFLATHDMSSNQSDPDELWIVSNPSRALRVPDFVLEYKYAFHNECPVTMVGS